MTFIEFIGFLITLVAFFFLMAKQAIEKRKRKDSEWEDEEELEGEEELEDGIASDRLLKRALESYGMEVRREEMVPKNVQPKKQLPIMQSQGMQSSRTHSSVPSNVKENGPPPSLFKDLKPVEATVFQDVWTDHTAYSLKKKHGNSRAKKLVGKDRSLKDAMILKEILGRPKAAL